MGRGPRDLQAVATRFVTCDRPNLERPGKFYLRDLAQSMLPVYPPIAFLFVKRDFRITFPSVE